MLVLCNVKALRIDINQQFKPWRAHKVPEFILFKLQKLNAAETAPTSGYLQPEAITIRESRFP